MEDATPVTFGLDELWLLQAVVRHGAPSEETAWPKFPPVSLLLNDMVADAIYACETARLPEYTLLLSRGDLLVIDYNVQASAKNTAGVLVGKSILLKSFAARRRLAGEQFVMADEPDDTEQRNRWIVLKEWKDDARTHADADYYDPRNDAI